MSVVQSGSVFCLCVCVCVYVCVCVFVQISLFSSLYLCSFYFKCDVYVIFLRCVFFFNNKKLKPVNKLLYKLVIVWLGLFVLFRCLVFVSFFCRFIVVVNLCFIELGWWVCIFKWIIAQVFAFMLTKMFLLILVFDSWILVLFIFWSCFNLFLIFLFSNLGFLYF